MRKRGNTVSSCISCDDVEVQKSPSTAAEQLNSFKNNAVETNIHCEKLPKSKVITVTNILDQIKEKNHETQPKRKLSVSSSLPRSQDAVILSVMDSVKSLQLIHFSTSPILETLPSVIRAISTGMTTYKTMTKMNTIDDEFITEISEAMNVQLESLKLLLVNCTEPLKMQLIFECMKEISSFFSN